jgi:type II secretory pathway pseudopilin PulG
VIRRLCSTSEDNASMKHVMVSRPELRARSAAGFAMIEVIVSAAVLALVALAVLAGIDGASSSAGREKARSVAATLAEQDQERLRSQQFYQLVTWAQTPPPVQDLTVDGVTYHVKSQASWMTDSTTGSNSCTSQSTNANYLKISSTVTSNVVGTRVAAVEQDSLVAPSPQYSANHGSLGARIVDRNGAGVQNIAVTTSGAGSYNGVTDANGCVIFPNIPVGNYTTTVNTAGYVDQLGNQSSSATGEVVSGSTTVNSIIYDRAATATPIPVYTYAPNAADTSAPVASQAFTLSATNGTIANLLRTFPNPPDASPTLHSSFTASNLFPFVTPYAFFTGSCLTDNPATYDTTSPVFNYWTSSPTPPGQLAAQPGVTATNLSVRQPPLLVNLAKTYNNVAIGSGNYTNIRVTAYPQTTGCTDQNITGLKLYQWTTANSAPTPANSSQYGWVGRGMVTVGGKSVPESGVPFGKYKFCFYDTSLNKKAIWPDYISSTAPLYDATKSVPGVANAVVANPTLTSQWSTGQCP